MASVLTKKDLIGKVSDFIIDSQRNSFENLALELFKFQFHDIRPLASYWRSVGATPNSITSFKDIPPIGLGVFKHHLLYGGGKPDKIFRTSGTSGKGRGSSGFDADDLALMDLSILTNATAKLFRDGLRTRFFMLVPSPEEAPEVIMAYGMRYIAGKFGVDEPFYAIRQGSFIGNEAVDILMQCTAEKIPVTLIGGSFGFVNFVEGVQGKLERIPLPSGSRILDAGGFKGRSRELDRQSFLAMMCAFFGLPEEQCINLYGLTELASQFYSRGHLPKQPAHWTRVRICDPLTLQEVAEGELGVPVLYDLANVARPFAVLTDDIGLSFGDKGFEIVGRASGSAPRGCSLSLEDVR